MATSSKLTWSCYHIMQTLLCFAAVFISNFLIVFSENILLNNNDNNNNNTSTNNAQSKLPPTVLIALVVRNEGHALPWVLGQLEILNYPKDRISFWIRSDHNIDNTSAILKEWAIHAKKIYHAIDLKIDEKSSGYADEESPCHWVKDRFIHVMNLRQKGLEKAKRVWADYLFLMDSDIVIENPDLFSILMAQNKPIISPQLNVSADSLYSNFWCGINEHGYYQRTPDYEPIVRWHKQGCFEVPMVHSVYLIDMNHVGVKKLSFSEAPPEYIGPFDDIIQFAFAAKHAGMSMHTINTEFFGHLMVPLDSKDSLEDEVEQFLHIKLEMIVIEPALRPSAFISLPRIIRSKLGFDQVYLINLVRRPERRRKMLTSLKQLGIDVFILNAVDGKTLNDTYLKQLGVKQLPGYADPYHGRQMTMGEIGCFLSHFVIWKDIVDNGYEKAIVFEDDVRFEIFFRQKLEKLLYECEYIVRNWDLVYLGRKRLFRKPEPEVEGTTMLIWPNYSYWTLSYILTLEGAQKLLDADPLSKMIPVDEYIPVMFDRHPYNEWKAFFFPRNVVGLSAEPLLVYPTHYTGESNYLSDTEDSELIEGEGEAEDESEIATAGLNVESPKVEL